MDLRVELGAGQGAEPDPRCLHLGARAVAVTEVLDRWPASEHGYYKLRGDDGGIYLLRHDHAGDRWELILFDAGRSDLTRLSST